MIKPIIRPIISSIRKAILRSGGTTPTEYYRYFFEFNADGNITFSPINLGTASMEIEFYIITRNLRAHIFSDSTASDRLFIDSNSDKLEIAGTGGTVIFNPLTLAIDNAYKVNIERDSGSNLYTYSINDTPIDTATSSAGNDLIFNNIANKITGGTTVPLFSGVIWNAKMWTGGNSSTGTLVYSAFINDNDTTIIDTASGNNGALTEGTGAWFLVSTTDPDSLDPNVWNSGSGWITSGGGGLPAGIITYDGEPLTFEGEYVTYGV